MLNTSAYVWRVKDERTKGWEDGRSTNELYATANIKQTLVSMDSVYEATNKWGYEYLVGFHFNPFHAYEKQFA